MPTESRDGTNYWAFNDGMLCDHYLTPGMAVVYCFENPWVDVNRSDRVDWEMPGDPFSWWRGIFASGFDEPVADAGANPGFAETVAGTGASHPETCYICACARFMGCFAPGVKIAMADGSLRKIEDIHAGDMVRNAKTGAPVKVGKVIEGSEALPLIRFGFEGTTVTTSQAHPVLTAAGLKPANELKTDDTIFDARGYPHPLTILETLPIEEGQRVINVNLDTASSDADERLIVSDGIITGDIVLQGLLKERK